MKNMLRRRCGKGIHKDIRGIIGIMGKTSGCGEG